MKIKIIALLFLIAISCNKKTEQLSEPFKIATKNDLLEGKKLMETQCYLCHSPKADENEGRIAPPMIAVKARYLMEYPSKENFTEAIVSFTEHP